MTTSYKKLTKSEWEHIEKPLKSKEIQILKLIEEGYSNPNIHNFIKESLISNIKIQNSEILIIHLFNLHFKVICDNINHSLLKRGLTIIDLNHLNKKNKKIILKKADQIRLNSSNILFDSTYEGLLAKTMTLCEEAFLKNHKKNNKLNLINAYKELYSLEFLTKLDIKNVNTIFLTFVKKYLDLCIPSDLKEIIFNAVSIIQCNNKLLTELPIKLFKHQKDIFQLFKNIAYQNKNILSSDEENDFVTSSQANLVYYTPPTGTGKTLTPIGLSKEFRIIFICAAKHVGLSLARACIAIEKKIAFAFGCKDHSDIRLHWFSVSECTRDKKSGKIKKVDNTMGQKVEILISDLESYIIGMQYMLAFNKKENIIMFWDEPTIGLDYIDHYNHTFIKSIWNENKIPNIILSSATLPSIDLTPQIKQNFNSKFPNANFYSIIGSSYKSDIQILNFENKSVLPHFIAKNYLHQKEIIKNIIINPILIRYIDLKLCCNFINFINNKDWLDNNLLIQNYFNSLEDITIENIKTYYLNIILYLPKERMEELKLFEKEFNIPLYESSIKISSDDAWSLTHGPTIYLAENIEKIAQFIITSAGIPKTIMDQINESLIYNSSLSSEISSIEKNINDLELALSGSEEKNSKTKCDKNKIKIQLKNYEQQLYIKTKQIKSINLPDSYIPNTKDHLKRFDKLNNLGKSFSPNIPSSTAEKILILPVSDGWKILLLMGIGVFIHSSPIGYTEIVKEMAYNQQLYLIIAASDYIYGTNYQFNHLYLGKDLNNITRDKTIQALGRIGRNNIGHLYTIRVRDNSMIDKLFNKCNNSMEEKNLIKLFT